MTVRTGTFVAQHLDPIPAPERVQPNGVDLTVVAVEQIQGKARFHDGDYKKPARLGVASTQAPNGQTESYWDLGPGSYALHYGEKVRIPNNHVGRVYPRSRFMRSGVHLTSALWDQGYEGRGEGLLQVPYGVSLTLEVGYPVGQLVLQRADEGGEQYDGVHQHEGIAIEVEETEPVEEDVPPGEDNSEALIGLEQ